MKCAAVLLAIVAGAASAQTVRAVCAAGIDGGELVFADREA